MGEKQLKMEKPQKKPYSRARKAAKNKKAAEKAVFPAVIGHL